VKFGEEEVMKTIVSDEICNDVFRDLFCFLDLFLIAVV
jgi:hypothetical protein